MNCEGPALTTAEAVAVGVGATVVAIIVASVIVGLVVTTAGGYAGYKYWLLHKGDMHAAQGNPLYQDNGRSGQNPFYVQSPKL